MVPDNVVETATLPGASTAVSGVPGKAASAYAAALLAAERQGPLGASGAVPRPVRRVGVIGAGLMAGPAEVDLCMLLGANFPEHQGGLTPMLDLNGAARRVWGRDFHPGPGFAE